MYKTIVRPLLFRIPPESAHHLSITGLKMISKIPGATTLLNKATTLTDPVLEREVFGIKFPNPVGIAAGFDKQAELFEQLANLGFGFVEIGTITPKGQPGNPSPRLFRLPKDKALINRMGFNNIGVDAAIAHLKKRKTDIIVGGNIGKNTTTPNDKASDDYLFCFTKLFDHVDYFVVNVSCPNISDLHELQDRKSLTELLLVLQQANRRKEKPKPVLLKVSGRSDPNGERNGN